ncbi:MAG TPA: AraC family transcriptional regulator [Ramlibacter sp.]
MLASPWEGVYATEIRSARHYGRHSHATFGFGVVDHGAHRSSSGRGTVDAYAGDIVTTNPGEVHDGRPLGGPSRTWCTVYLEPGELASMLPQAPAADLAITRPVLADGELQRATRGLLAALRRWQQGAADELACEEALVQACGLLLARHTTRPACESVPDVALARVRQRLADALAQPPKLAELAALAGVSRFQLLRRFAAAYGCTPHAWLLQQRAERARALIRAGLALSEAAAACGFADQSHMTRIFTRQFGFTPGAWQRAGAPQ